MIDLLGAGIFLPLLLHIFRAKNSEHHMYFGILLYDKIYFFSGGGEDGKRDEMPENAGWGGGGASFEPGDEFGRQVTAGFNSASRK